MSEAYFPVESGALGPEENFLSLDDILMSQEKLPVRVETPMPRLGAFFLERGAGSEPDHPLPQVRRARPGQRFPRSGGGGSPRGSREAAQHSKDSPATDLSLQTFQSHWLWLQPIISGSLGSIHGFHKTYLKFRSLGTADCHAHSAQL